jgi:hypothetical protein
MEVSMKHHIGSQYPSKIWLGLFAVAVLAALLFGPLANRIPARSANAAAPAAAFQTLARPWTGVGSTGTIDESSLNIFAFGTTDLGFKPAVQGNVIVARYNVTNTFDNNANPNRPGWTTLEMGSNAPTNTIIEARLFTVKACGVEPVLICMARNRSNDQPCAKCSFNNGTIDFTSSLYYVEVKLDRSAAPAAMPRLFTLRVY